MSLQFKKPKEIPRQSKIEKTNKTANWKEPPIKQL